MLVGDSVLICDFGLARILNAADVVAEFESSESLLPGSWTTLHAIADYQVLSTTVLPGVREVITIGIPADPTFGHRWHLRQVFRAVP